METVIRGQTVLIDDEDAHLLEGHTWYIVRRYVVRHRGGKGPSRHGHIYLHREVQPPPPGMFVDHANGNTFDNRRSNLRVCTVQENQRNSRPRRRGSTHGFKGIWKNSGRWVALIKVDDKRIYLGRHDTAEQAATAYDAAARKYFGEFAWLNFPDSEAA